MRFLRDYDVDDYYQFSDLYPERAEKLNQFISDWSTNSIFDKDTPNDNYIISITLPIGYDEGVAMVDRKDGDKITVLEGIVF